MHNGECITDNTFFQASELKGMDSGLHCLLSNGAGTVNFTQGMWLDPSGNPVNCNKEVNDDDPIGCYTTTENDGVTLYLFDELNVLDGKYSGVYTCCLPGNCSDGISSHGRVWIFG